MKRPSFLWAAPAISRIGNRFGFDAHYFAKNSAMVTLAHGISTLKGIITGYLVTRLFPPEMYGEYRFVLGVVGTVGFIGLPGLSTALASAIARKESISLERIARWYTFFCSIGSLSLIVCIPFLHYWGRENLWSLFFIAALIFTPSSVSTNLFGGIIRGTGEFSRAFFTSLIINVLVTLSVLTMLLIKPSSLLLLAFTSGIPGIVYFFYVIPFERRFRSKASQKPLLMRAAHLSIATIPSTLSWYIDGLLLSAFFGLNQLALFSVALLIPEQVKIWTKELFPILFSRQASGKDTPDRRKKMHQAVIAGTLIFALGIACYVLITPFIIPLLFPQYPAKELILLTNITAMTLIVAPASIYPQFLEARGVIKGVHLSNWIASGAFVVALFTLIPLWGAIGAIFARGVFRLTYTLTAFILIQRIPTEK